MSFSRNGTRTVGVWSLLAVVLAVSALGAPRKTGPADDKALDGIDDNNKKGIEGDFYIAIVGPDGNSINTNRFVRGIPRRWAVSEFPHVFSLDGKALFTAGDTLDANIPAADAVAIFCKADADSDGVTYNGDCTARIPPGNYTIAPFGLKFEVGHDVTARHAALSADGKKLTIHTTPVTFRSVDKAGISAPLSGFQLVSGSTNLLEHLVDSTGAPVFSSLTLYLPRGSDYRSSFGNFRIDERGTLVAGDVTKGVKVDGSTLVQEIDATNPPAEPAVAKGYWLTSHNQRRVFKRGESARFDVIIAGQYPQADLPVVLRAGDKGRAIGKLALPAVTGNSDSRLFLLDTGKLAPGKYELSLDHADAHPFAFEIVELQTISPLYLLTVNACGESDFAIDSDGLEELRKANVRCWVTYGHGSAFGRLADGAVKQPYPAAPADAPPELRRVMDPPRLLLDDTLRHGLVMIDYENRRAGWYNEGLAFHHTHPMTVDRMVRRVQIFGQELEDYPAFSGMSYTWFPCLGGYIEGGVCIDPFFGTRMDILRKKVKDLTGFEPITGQESEKMNKGPMAEKRRLSDQARNYWRVEQRMGWADTLAHYNAKLREVRPDFICTMSENAGHDSGKSLPDMASANDVMCFESYTDFGDWPMSAGFVADWAHGQIGAGKPVWQSVDPSQSEPSLAGKQFYKFARGVEGIANGIHPPSGAGSNAKRAKTNKFLERYGALVTDWSADTQVAVCVSEVQFAEYDAHALHSYLTRLGYGPIIVSERTLEATGVPAGLKVVCIPNLRIPFSTKAEEALKSFMGRGGKVLLVGEKNEVLDGAIVVQTTLKTLFDVGGFASHMPFWDEFKKVRPALEKAMADIGLSPRNGAAPEKAVVIPSKSGGVRYVTVISSSIAVRDTEFLPATGIIVKTGTGKRIINLVTGAELAPKDGTVTLDLVDEPVAFLAILEEAPQSVTLHGPAEVAAGNVIELSAEVASGTARAPVEYTIADAKGAVRARYYRLSSDKQPVSYRVPETDAGGEYTLKATELLTGLTAAAKVAVKTASTISAVSGTEPVYLPHPDRIGLFMKRQEPVRIVVEETQGDLLPQAQRLVAAFTKAGRNASIQRVSDASYDMYWLRFIPNSANLKTMAKIDAGEVVGYRGDLKAFINTSKRAQVPEKGGWEDIGPKYILRSDVVLFSGGRIADSLGALTDWMQTKDFPGKDRGVLEVALSPFWADRDAIAVVATDDAGRKRSVDRLVDLIENAGKVPPSTTLAPAVIASSSVATVGKERITLETPLKGFVPAALVDGLAAAPDGSAAIQMRNATAIVSTNGSVHAIPRSGIPTTVLNGGEVFAGAVTITALQPSWHFPTAWKVTVEHVDGTGHLQKFDVPSEFAGAGDQFDGWDAGFAVSSDAKSYFAARDGGGFFLFDLTAKSVKAVDEPTNDLRFYEQVRVPVSVTAAKFSPDGSRVVYTVGNHPTSYGGMMGPSPSPMATALRVVDAKTGKTIWIAEGLDARDSSTCAVARCLSISEAGRRIALIDYDHNATIFDAEGHRIFHKPIFDWRAKYQSNAIPKPMRCELSRDGATALFVSDGNILLTDGDGKTIASFIANGLSDVCLTPDGSRVFGANLDGHVTAYDRAGKPVWELQTQGERPKIAVVDAGLLVAEGAGNLLTVDTAGKILKTVAFALAKLDTSEFETVSMAAAPTYREPQTLAMLQKFGAKLMQTWEPQGQAKEAFGKKFHPVGGPVTLEAAGTGPRLVHLVYRHGEKPVLVTLADGAKPLTFSLDLPTPEYRVVDLPYDAKQKLTVNIPAVDGLEIAELSVYSYAFPSTNGLFVRPAGADPDGLGNKKPVKGEADPDLLLDDKDTGGAAKAASGKMKNAAIFSNNPDPDQIEGHYLRATGNPLEAFDGQRFLDGKPSIWTRVEKGPFGSRLLVDLNHSAKPKLCATYERTLKQSEVMRGIAVMKGKKADFLVGEDPGPDRLGREKRVVAGVIDNDQFFNVFDTRSVEMEALGIYVFSRDGKDLGLSEVELYE